ncbi:hypothetical protein D3C76_1383300 [compost metagenome]
MQAGDIGGGEQQVKPSLVGESCQGLIEVLGRQIQADLAVLLGARLPSTHGFGRQCPNRAEQCGDGG